MNFISIKKHELQICQIEPLFLFSSKGIPVTSLPPPHTPHPPPHPTPNPPHPHPGAIPGATTSWFCFHDVATIWTQTLRSTIIVLAFVQTFSTKDLFDIVWHSLAFLCEVLTLMGQSIVLIGLLIALIVYSCYFRDNSSHYLRMHSIFC